jgi:tetratricopeptide (TPR) repeat protein
VPIDAGLSDPTALLHGLEVRRAALKEISQQRADVLLLITGVSEGDRTGSVSPFSHTAVVADFPNRSENENSLILAHELAHLFGAPHETSSTLMAETPRSAYFSSRALALIRHLRNYDFAAGVDGLQGYWDHRAVLALTDAFTGFFRNPGARAYAVIGGAFANEGRNVQAIAHLREVTRLDPKSASARLNLAAVLTRNVEYDEAVKELREGIRLDPRDPQIHTALGVVLAKMGIRAEAFDELQGSLQLGQSDAPLYIALGSVLEAEPGRLNAAMAAFKAAVVLDPASMPAQQGLARVRLLKKRREVELMIQRSRVQQAPGSAIAHFDLGVAETQAGNYQSASTEFKKAIQLNPKEGHAHANLALIHYNLGDYPAAWQDVKNARISGFEPPAAFLNALKRKMPE